jgi:hypothetical protein
MTNVERIENDPLRKAGRIPEYTLEYLDAKKEAERKERWCGRNWIRMPVYFLPYTSALILVPKLQIGWGSKICLLAVLLVFCQFLYVRVFNRAVLKRLDAELRAPGD